MRKQLIITMIIVGVFEIQGISSEKTEEEKPHYDPRAETTVTDHYVHQWRELPPVTGKALFSGGFYKYQVQRGELAVVVFIASHCIKCQELMNSLLDLERFYKKIGARFIYVFSQDLLEDALGFAKEYGLDSELVLADEKTLKAYHQPKLPTIYFSDRFGWFNWRIIDFAASDLEKINQYLALQTSY